MDDLVKRIQSIKLMLRTIQGRLGDYADQSVEYRCYVVELRQLEAELKSSNNNEVTTDE